MARLLLGRMRLTILFIFLSFVSYGQMAVVPTGQKIPAFTTTDIDDQVSGTAENQNTYTGTFVIGAAKAGTYLNTISFSTTTASTFIEMDFTGFRVEWYSERSTNHGIIACSVDGGPETMVDQYGTESLKLKLFEWESLTRVNASHTIKLRVTNTKNALSSGVDVNHDFFRVFKINETTVIPAPPVDGVVVRKTGSDAFPCTDAQPCFTVQRGVNVTPVGGTLTVGAGTYREAITPPISGTLGNPITIKAETGATVVISGLEDAGAGWTLHTGNIWKKNLTLPNPLNFDEDVDGSAGNIMANQVFKDGEMMHQARYPDVSTPEDYLDKSKYRAIGSTSLFSQTQITDAGIPAGINGAKLFVQGWFLSQTSTLTNQVGSTITYSPLYIADANFRKFYYLTDHLALLNTAKEWHYQSGVLYFWQPGGGSPTGVEYKARSWAFDLSGKSYINIEGINFIGCDPVKTTTSGSTINLDKSVISYPNYAFIISDAGANYTRAADQSGVKILAPNSSITNCTIKYAGAMGVWLGTNCTADNNLIYDVNWLGMFGAPFKPWPGTNGQKILHNTSYRAGRGHVELSSADANNMEIAYNDFSYHNMVSIDGGAIYSQAHKNHTGSRFHHNWFHHTAVVRIGSLNGIQICGVYLDQMSGPAAIDHNVHWNGDEADYYTELKNVEGTIEVTGPKLIYNNTFEGANTSLGYYQSYVSYGNPPAPKIDIQRNNIYSAGIDARVSTANVANSIMSTTDPLYIGGSLATDKGLYFQLQAGSPAINAGTSSIGSPYTDGVIGNPDAGAYERTVTPWVPGCESPANVNCP